MTFADAADSVCAWIAQLPEIELQPRVAIVSAPTDASGIGVAPWRLDSPRIKHTDEGLVFTATARFCVWTWAKDLRSACAMIDAIFFSAMNDPIWRLSELEPPERFWQSVAQPALVLAREIDRKPAELKAAPVKDPLVFDITTRASARAPGQRT